MSKCAGSSVCVTIESGAFGDDGKVYDVETGAMKYPKAYTDSMTISSRVVMYQPPFGAHGYIRCWKKSETPKAISCLIVLLQQ